MARRTRRTRRRSYRSGGLMLLVMLLLGAVLLLYLLSTGRIQVGGLDIPLTGVNINLPGIQLPLQINAQPIINATSLPGGTAAFAPQTKTSGCTLQGSLPDPACTPGAAINVSASQVCAQGYTNDGGEGPPASQVFAAYGVSDDGSYAIDHLVPLALGGTNTTANLWPIPANDDPGPVEKDAAEVYLREQVCSGALALAEAQQQIASNWIQVYNRSLP